MISRTLASARNPSIPVRPWATMSLPASSSTAIELMGWRRRSRTPFNARRYASLRQRAGSPSGTAATASGSPSYSTVHASSTAASTASDPAVGKLRVIAPSTCQRHSTHALASLASLTSLIPPVPIASIAKIGLHHLIAPTGPKAGQEIPARPQLSSYRNTIRLQTQSEHEARIRASDNTQHPSVPGTHSGLLDGTDGLASVCDGVASSTWGEPPALAAPFSGSCGVGRAGRRLIRVLQVARPRCVRGGRRRLCDLRPSSRSGDILGRRGLEAVPISCTALVFDLAIRCLTIPARTWLSPVWRLNTLIETPAPRTSRAITANRGALNHPGRRTRSPERNTTVNASPSNGRSGRPCKSNSPDVRSPNTTVVRPYRRSSSGSLPSGSLSSSSMRYPGINLTILKHHQS